jgi:hypothetical protein
MSHIEGPLTSEESSTSDIKTEGRGLKTSKDLAKVIARDIDPASKSDRTSKLPEWLKSNAKTATNGDKHETNESLANQEVPLGRSKKLSNKHEKAGTRPSQVLKQKALSAKPKRPFFESYLKTVKPELQPKEVKPFAPSTEHIGQLVLPSEAIVAGQTSRRSELTHAGQRPEITKTDMDPEQAYKLNHRELMLMSEKIVIEGSSLKQIYENHLIGERGLRRLLSEYLKGQDIKKALKREMVEKQIDFERDPILRDRSTSNSTSNISSIDNDADQVLTGLITKASASLGGNSSSEHYPQAGGKTADQPEDKVQQLPLSEVTILGTIIILLAAIAVIYLTRH